MPRKVVRKVLISEETAFEYKRTVQPLPKLGPWREELDRLLAANAARGSRERVTAVALLVVQEEAARCATPKAPRAASVFVADAVQVE